MNDRKQISDATLNANIENINVYDELRSETRAHTKTKQNTKTHEQFFALSLPFSFVRFVSLDFLFIFAVVGDVSAAAVDAFIADDDSLMRLKCFRIIFFLPIFVFFAGSVLRTIPFVVYWIISDYMVLHALPACFSIRVHASVVDMCMCASVVWIFRVSK